MGFWLGGVNGALAVFNLIPGFPLDGGRILRSIVWGITKNYTKASRIAARGGQIVAYGLIGYGVWEGVRGWQTAGSAYGLVDGLWLMLIGWFLLGAAKQSFAQAETRTVLEGLKASDIMSSEPASIGREISLEDYAREVTSTGRASHLVMAHGQLVGIISTDALTKIPREDWCVTSVQAAMTPREKMVWASPEEPALALLDRMRTAGTTDAGTPGRQRGGNGHARIHCASAAPRESDSASHQRVAFFSACLCVLCALCGMNCPLPKD